MERRAQVALEYLFILVITLIIIGVVLYAIMAGNSSDESMGYEIACLRDMINNSL